MSTYPKENAFAVGTTVVRIDYLQDGACRKYKQLVREIENHDSYENLLHSAYKLGEFLKTALGEIWKLPDENEDSKHE